MHLVNLCPITLQSLPCRLTRRDTSGHMSDYDISLNIHEFMIAGSDTTANTVAYAIYSLAQNPHVEAKMVAEIDAFEFDKGDGVRRPTHDDLEFFPYVDLVRGLRESLWALAT